MSALFVFILDFACMLKLTGCVWCLPFFPFFSVGTDEVLLLVLLRAGPSAPLIYWPRSQSPDPKPEASGSGPPGVEARTVREYM